MDSEEAVGLTREKTLCGKGIVSRFAGAIDG